MRTAALSVATSVAVATGLLAGPGQAEPTKAQAEQLVGLFYNSCVRHIGDNWQGLGATMRKLGLRVEERPEMRDRILKFVRGGRDRGEGKVWSGQGPAGKVLAALVRGGQDLMIGGALVPPKSVCAIHVYEADATLATMKQIFRRASDRLLAGLSGDDGTKAEREILEGDLKLGTRRNDGSFERHLFTVSGPDTGVAVELADVPIAAGVRRYEMSLAHFDVEG